MWKSAVYAAPILLSVQKIVHSRARQHHDSLSQLMQQGEVGCPFGTYFPNLRQKPHFKESLGYQETAPKFGTRGCFMMQCWRRQHWQCWGQWTVNYTLPWIVNYICMTQVLEILLDITFFWDWTKKGRFFIKEGVVPQLTGNTTILTPGVTPLVPVRWLHLTHGSKIRLKPSCPPNPISMKLLHLSESVHLVGHSVSMAGVLSLTSTQD